MLDMYMMVIKCQFHACLDGYYIRSGWFEHTIKVTGVGLLALHMCLENTSTNHSSRQGQPEHTNNKKSPSYVYRLSTYPLHPC